MGGGEQMMMSALGGEEPMGPAAASMSFVEHGTGASSVTVAQGGTVVVDLVISSDAPLLGFEARPAASVSGVVSIDASGWTATSNVLYSLGRPGKPPASYYNFNALDWYAVFPDLATFRQGGGAPGVAVETGRSLVQITGPRGGEVMNPGYDLDALDGPVGIPSVGVLSTTAMLSGSTKWPPPSGQVIVATLTLHVSGRPGTYALSLTGSTCFTTHGETEMTTGAPFTITVQSQ